jgi:nitrogen fixation protein FixH
MGVLVSIAVDDPHFALESNYYDKAVHWDTSRAEAKASSALGLELALAPTLERAADGTVTLELGVADRGHTGFVGGTVQIEAFPNAYAKEVQRVTLRETSPGVYRGQLARSVLGLWELRVTVTRGRERFYEVLRRDVLRGGAA